LGSFNWVTARTLIAFGLGAGHAKRFSIILWAVITIPLVIIGFLALAITGVKMSHLHRDAAAAAKQNKEEAATRSIESDRLDTIG
jgi:glycosyltransferase 2 family protein